MKMELTVDAAQKAMFETQLRGIVHIKTGLSIDKYRMDDIWRMLDKLQATFAAFSKLSFNLLNEWINSLAIQSVESSEWRALIEVITIGETYFFRDAAQMRALQNHVLPQIIDSHRINNFKHLRIWSAGCATGEEAYTLAMLLRESIPDIADWTFTILGTDINQTSLETARIGIYKQRSFRDETRTGIRDRWFRPSGKDFELDPEIRRMVKFAPLNLVSDTYPSFETETMNFDLILCRNVTIYFNEATTRQIIERFYKALSPTGWLVVGHSEPMVSAYREFTPCNLENAVVYYKDVRNQNEEMADSYDFSSKPNPQPQPARSTTPEPRPLAKTGMLPSLPTSRVTSRTSTMSTVPSMRPLGKTGLLPPIPTTLKTTTMPTVGSTRSLAKTGMLPTIPSNPKTTTVPAVTAQNGSAKPDSLQAAQEAANQEDWNALEHWLKVAERDDTLNPQLYYLRALMFMNLGELALACDDLRRAIYCDPLFALAYYVLGEVYEKRGIPREARRSWEQARQALTQMEPERMAASGNGMTIEILQGFITYQLEKLTEG